MGKLARVQFETRAVFEEIRYSLFQCNYKITMKWCFTGLVFNKIQAFVKTFLWIIIVKEQSNIVTVIWHGEYLPCKKIDAWKTEKLYIIIFSV